jgi:LmbE family N-acetylglucosaminyl deacetylase
LTLTAALSLFLAPASLFAKPPRQPNAAELLRDIERLSVVGNVLYVAAHPDDENTRLLAYLVNEKHLRAAYLSVTRGEGGQNLIGSEQGPLLGVIRTQELLAARRIDGAEQFFTRARDFGYSKTPEETLDIWGKDQVLADYVWVIRSFKPDVIISRFPTNGAETHGHHTASAMLAVEAFRAAADPKFHPQQLKYVSTWQAKRVVWNRFVFNARPGDDVSGFVKQDVGTYSPLLGVSYGELAAESRSMHKSQGFGVAPGRGPALEYFQVQQGEPAQQSVFDGIDFTWSRVAGSKRLTELLAKAKEQLKVESPHTIIPILLDAYAALQALPPNPWKEHKQSQLVNAIAACAGLWVDAYSSDFSVVPGGELKVNVLTLNRSPAGLQLREIRFPDGGVVAVNKPLANNEPLQQEQTVHVPVDASYSNPYWLDQPPDRGTFRVSDPKLIGLPEQPPTLSAELVFSIGGRTFSMTRPISHKWTDPVAGERYRSVDVVPPVTINPSATTQMFPDPKPRELRLVLKSGMPNAEGVLRAELPAGWSAHPASIPFKLGKKGAEQELTLEIRPPEAKTLDPSDSLVATLRLVAEVAGKKSSRSLIQIEHSHIPIQTLFPDAEVKLVRFDLKTGKKKLGYIVGAGDEVPVALRQVGYAVTLLGEDSLRNEPLGQFDAIVVGVRAYNTQDRMPFYYKKLMDYVAGGGTLVVQYNTVNFISRAPPEIGPYSFEISRDRVTDETAAVTFEIPRDPILQKPNKLAARDFEGWVQERGLYFAGKWDEHYRTPVSMHDPGESPKRGGLLVTTYGKGAFIYTGLAFFRQLPAGVPGAYRLFANLISYGK